MESRRASAVAGLLLVASVASWWIAWHPPGRAHFGADPASARREEPTIGPASFEEWARQEFLRRHPGERPLNWRIAEKAEESRDTRPMGRFVLGANDCSDFTDAILDEALGVGARYRRGSVDHVLAYNTDLWEFHGWVPGALLMPGDEIAVRHSPYYAPYPSAPWHRGIVGTDGLVYDWTKLRSWGTDRYGRHPLDWFVRHSPGPNEVIIRRLKALYRYRLQPVPVRSAAVGGER